MSTQATEVDEIVRRTLSQQLRQVEWRLQDSRRAREQAEETIRGIDSYAPSLEKAAAEYRRLLSEYGGPCDPEGG